MLVALLQRGAEITRIRVARDRLFGVTSPEATSSRRYEARALLLLAREKRRETCLLCTLAVEHACRSGEETPSVGQILYQRARVERALGNTERAFGLAEDAYRVFLAALFIQGAARLARRGS